MFVAGHRLLILPGFAPGRKKPETTQQTERSVIRVSEMPGSNPYSEQYLARRDGSFLLQVAFHGSFRGAPQQSAAIAVRVHLGRRRSFLAPVATGQWVRRLEHPSTGRILAVLIGACGADPTRSEVDRVWQTATRVPAFGHREIAASLLYLLAHRAKYGVPRQLGAVVPYRPPEALHAPNLSRRRSSSSIISACRGTLPPVSCQGYC